MPTADYELSRDIIHADRAWHDLEMGLAEEARKAGKPARGFPDIVDINVLPRDENPVSFSDRDEVRAAYEGFLADPRLRGALSGEFIRGRLAGQLLHLDLLGGGQTNVFHHIETNMGSELTLVNEDYLDARQEAIEAELAKHGLGFDAVYAPEFEEKLGVARNRQAMRRHIITFTRRTGLLAVGEKPGESLVVPDIVEEDASWAGYFSTHNETGEPFSQLNAHPRQSYTRGRAAAVAVHEATGHAADFAYKHNTIQHGRMDPLFGVTVPFGRENVTAETIALGREQQVLRSVQGRRAWEYHLQAEYHDYFEMVWNNALVYINTGMDEDRAFAYVRGRSLPNETDENIRGRLQDLRDDPTWRANQGAYEPGMRIVRQVLTLPAAQQERFFREISQYPYDEAQMQAKLLGKTATADFAVAA